VAKRKGPTKPEGEELHPRTTSRKKAKPVETAPVEPPRYDDQPDYPDQTPPQRRTRRPPEGPPGYVRFQIHVDDGNLSVAGSHYVDSPLMLPPAIDGGYAYEVTDGSRLLHADALPDLGVSRSFANPSGSQAQQRHHIERQASYDFNVRVPAAELDPASLANLDIVLYRVKERAPERVLHAAAPLGVQMERELREVSRLSGITEDALPAELRRARRPRKAS
jgi:hypothetical protein